ncbi:site-2 protease family protein [Nakamurella sp. YIM 132087]|uniref:Site-2 protease family protein n=1 Tax=Nakamurella alba TaxID=2665158 RepID=A0A7K1FRM0_9ACTN|nr:site-2 protease family protein [Nakamurella alba]MTD16786.1 site-2 protease family protein [Nakamurella alba]
MTQPPAPARKAPRGPSAGIPLGRLGGIRIVLSWSWLLSVVIIAALATPIVEQAVPGTTRGTSITIAILLGVLLGASVLVHELGHCMAARALGIPVLQVRLYLLGGVSELGRVPTRAREEAVVAAAGPGLSVVLAGLFFLFVGGTDERTLGWLILLELALANAVIAVFNLLPALPLDGGRVLRAGVWRATGRRRWGTVAGAIGGYVIAAALIVYSIVQFGGMERAGLLQGVIGVAMALFIGAGALAEQRGDRAVTWPSDAGLAALARPVVQLPQEVPVGLALQAAGDRAVVLTSAEGFAAGLLDERAAIAAARTDPSRPALSCATPIRPEMVVLVDDDPAEIALRLRDAGPVLLLVDADGHPAGVVPTAEVDRLLRNS